MFEFNLHMTFHVHNDVTPFSLHLLFGNIDLSKLGKLNFWNTHPKTDVPYMFYTNFHSSRPIFYSPSSKCERVNVSFPHWIFPQIMACCLMAPSHCLNICWLIIKGVLWHPPPMSPEVLMNFIHNTCLEITPLKLLSYEFKCCYRKAGPNLHGC